MPELLRLAGTAALILLAAVLLKPAPRDGRMMSHLTTCSECSHDDANPRHCPGVRRLMDELRAEIAKRGGR